MAACSTRARARAALGPARTCSSLHFWISFFPAIDPFWNWLACSWSCASFSLRLASLTSSRNCMISAFTAGSSSSVVVCACEGCSACRSSEICCCRSAFSRSLSARRSTRALSRRRCCPMSRCMRRSAARRSCTSDSRRARLSSDMALCDCFRRRVTPARGAEPARQTDSALEVPM